MYLLALQNKGGDEYSKILSIAKSHAKQMTKKRERDKELESSHHIHLSSTNEENLEPIDENETEFVKNHPLRTIWLNLDESVGRRREMERMFRGIETDYDSDTLLINQTKFSAVDTRHAFEAWQNGRLEIPGGITLVDAYDGTLPLWKERHVELRYKLAEAACLLSHLEAVIHAYNEGQELVLILEDDAVLSKEFVSQWKAYANTAPADWKVLQWVTDNDVVLKQGLNLRDPWISWTPGHYSTRAYMLNRDGMKSILDATHSLSPTGANLWKMPEGMVVADEVIYHIAGRAYTSTHPWIDSNGLDSTIEDGRIHSTATSLSGYSSSLPLKAFKPRQESILVLTSARLASLHQISEFVQRLQLDMESMCVYHETCDWAVNIALAETSLEDALEKAMSTLPLNVEWKAEVNSDVFNKFDFVSDFLTKMSTYDYVLFADSDQRVAGMPWNTFMDQKSDSVVSGVLREAIEESLLRSNLLPKRQWFRFHDAEAWKESWQPKWANRLAETAQPAETPFVESYFALIEGDFAEWFFQRAMTPFFQGQPSDWGPDMMWCAAAKEYKPLQTSCSIVPVVSLHDDLRQIAKTAIDYQTIGDEMIAKFKQEPIFNSWMSYSAKWKEIIGGTNLHEITRLCSDFLEGTEFDLGKCVNASIDMVTPVPQASNGHGDEHNRIVEKEKSPIRDVYKKCIKKRGKGQLTEANFDLWLKGPNPGLEYLDEDKDFLECANIRVQGLPGRTADLLDAKARESQPKAIIHVGPFKTGSTAIQVAAGEKYLSKLRDANIVPIVHDYEAYHFSSCFMLSKIPYEYVDICKQERAKKLYSKITNQINRARQNGETVLFSSEGLSLDVDIDSVKKFFHGFDIHVVVVYRRYFEWAVSGFGQIYRHYPNLDQWGMWRESQPWRQNVVTYLSDPQRLKVKYAHGHTLEIYKRYQDAGVNMHVVNFHDDSGVVKAFFCHEVLNTPEICDLERQGTPTVANKAETTLYDELAVAAKESGLLDGIEVTRPTARRLLQDYYENELGLSESDLPHTCIEGRALQLLNDISVQVESHELVRTLDEKFGFEEELSQRFEAYKTTKFCSVDTAVVLTDHGESIRSILSSEQQQAIAGSHEVRPTTSKRSSLRKSN